MTISVIIPCFNEENYLDNCLTTLSQQTLLPDEVIICNNNSTDNSVVIAKNYLKKLPLKIINQPIKGIMPTVEKAWRSSTGDIIIRTDADASFPKDWLKNIINHFNNDSKLSACGYNWRSYDGNILMKTAVIVGMTLSDLTNPLIFGYKQLFGPNTAIRRQALKKINGYISDDPKALDDQLLSKKLFESKLKYAKFPDCYNYHSSRRYSSLKVIIKTVLSNYNPKFYDEKPT